MNVKVAAEASDCNDTLVCTKDGFLRKTVPITACNDDSRLTIHMYSENLDLTSKDYPVVDGSTSTQPLGIVLAATLLGTSYGYETDFSGFNKMVAFSTSKPLLADSINTKIIKHNGTHGAIMNAIDGKAILSLVARLPSEDELGYADSLGVSLRIQS